MFEMPKTLEECIELRGSGDCLRCDYLPRKLGTWERCNRRIALKYNR